MGGAYIVSSDISPSFLGSISMTWCTYEAWPQPQLKGLDQQAVSSWPHLQLSCGRGGRRDIGWRDGSGIPGGRVSGGRAAVWEAEVCIEVIVVEGSEDDDGLSLTVVGGGVAVEVLVFFFLGVLTRQWARRLLMTVRASPTSWLEPLAETTCTPEIKCGETDILAWDISWIWWRPVPSHPIMWPANLSGMDTETEIFSTGAAGRVVVEWILIEGITVADNVVGAVVFAFLGAHAFLGAGPAFGLGAEEGVGAVRATCKVRGDRL